MYWGARKAGLEKFGNHNDGGQKNIWGAKRQIGAKGTHWAVKKTLAG